jgi:hypothetical protein
LGLFFQIEKGKAMDFVGKLLLKLMEKAEEEEEIEYGQEKAMIGSRKGTEVLHFSV